MTTFNEIIISNHYFYANNVNFKDIVEFLHNSVKNHNLDISPQFRNDNRLWDESRSLSYLHDVFSGVKFNNEIIISEDLVTKQFILVDGFNRLSSVKAFITNKLAMALPPDGLTFFNTFSGTMPTFCFFKVLFVSANVEETVKMYELINKTQAIKTTYTVRPNDVLMTAAGPEVANFKSSTANAVKASEIPVRRGRRQ